MSLSSNIISNQRLLFVSLKYNPSIFLIIRDKQSFKNNTISVIRIQVTLKMMNIFIIKPIHEILIRQFFFYEIMITGRTL